MGPVLGSRVLRNTTQPFRSRVSRKSRQQNECCEVFSYLIRETESSMFFICRKDVIENHQSQETIKTIKIGEEK